MNNDDTAEHFTAEVPQAWAALLALTPEECRKREQPKPTDRPVAIDDPAVYQRESRTLYARDSAGKEHPGVAVRLFRRLSPKDYAFDVYFIETMVAWDLKEIPFSVYANPGVCGRDFHLEISEQPK